MTGFVRLVSSPEEAVRDHYFFLARDEVACWWDVGTELTPLCIVQTRGGSQHESYESARQFLERIHQAPQ